LTFPIERMLRTHYARLWRRARLLTAFGVIFFNYHTAQHEFKESELNFSRQVATIAGISLSNAKLFNEAKHSSQELSEYAHALTHNLKGPLRAIHNYVNFLFEDLADTLDGEPKRYLEGMRDAIIQSGAQFKGLETFYRVKKHPMDFERFKIEDLLDEMQSVYKNNSVQELIVASNWPVFKGEKFLLRQVLFNLISNGITELFNI
jgi:light-regulated signal transduction histidine kinase (bacteriophytochrome)